MHILLFLIAGVGSSTEAAFRRWLVDNLDKKGFEELRSALADVRREKKLPHIDEVRYGDERRKRSKQVSLFRF